MVVLYIKNHFYPFRSLLSSQPLRNTAQSRLQVDSGCPDHEDTPCASRSVSVTLTPSNLEGFSCVRGRRLSAWDARDTGRVLGPHSSHGAGPRRLHFKDRPGHTAPA